MAANIRRSRASLGDRSRLRLQRTVTWRDRRAELTVGFRLIAGARCWPSFPGLSSSGRCPMTTSTALATIQPAFTDAERRALAGFLAGYRGLTREAYALDLRQFTTWCRARSVSLFAVRRADIETFARDLEGPGPCTRHHYPAAVHHRGVLQVRGPRRTPGPLPSGPCPPAAGRLRVSCRRAGPQRARRAAGRRRTVPLRDVQEAASPADPRTTVRYDRGAAAWTGTPLTSSQPTSRALPGNASAGISFARRSPAGRSCPAPI